MAKRRKSKKGPKARLKACIARNKGKGKAKARARGKCLAAYQKARRGR